MFTLIWASLIKSRRRISRCQDCIHFYSGFKGNILKCRLNTICKGEAQSRIMTALSAVYTREYRSIYPLSLPSLSIFSPVHFYNSWAVLKSHKAPDDNWRW